MMFATLHCFKPLTVRRVQTQLTCVEFRTDEGLSLCLHGAAAAGARALAAQLLTVADQIDAELPSAVELPV